MSDEQKQEVVLIDLSSIAHMMFHVSGAEPDPDFTAKKTLERVYSLAQGRDYVTVCCDSGRSFRKDLAPEYKANRGERNAIVEHQIGLVREALVADGFNVLAAPGLEADDLLGVCCMAARAAGHPVLVVTGDKDLAVLITPEPPEVMLKSVQTGNLMDTEAAIAKWGVLPAQMVDWLTIVGDKSDNIISVKGLGEATAVKVLKEHGTLDAFYEHLDETGVSGLPPSFEAKMKELRPRLDLLRTLVTLRTDQAVNVGTLLESRVPPPMVVDEPEPTEEEQMDACIEETMPDSPQAETVSAQADEGKPITAQPMTNMACITKPTEGVVVPYDRQLDPTDSRSAIAAAVVLFKSRVFSAGSEQEVLARIMAGRELGIPAITSLRTIRIIDGNMSMSAQLIVALVLKSGFAAYFRVTERTNESATFITQRHGDLPVSLTFTVEDGKRAWPSDEKAWAKSGWGRNPADMCVARASSKLARLVYPDIVANVYSPEEIAEMREAHNG